ncbi:type II toxin-antitoxin system VapC family toxin [Deinococcus detaillensis]|uniref:Type II toxin-antitoxin system VapC family toxin n=1 Tax=Deinococcus detaillensis TaxID=2592048 RepID=A0A553UK69_9DEIO|nr:type II toxin-antitoxin system VapC family toxin [Deinococcus detaillensis]TSA80589.1 type II toxin-antitoxin system VapC family toxin [Deinococcus detaillensis]
MSTALDSNVLLSLWNAEPAAPKLAAALDRLATQGRLVVCGAVYAELSGFYPDLDVLLRTYGVSADPQMPLIAWRRAGVAHTAYSARRRASGGGLPRRILTDFLVGAHASTFGHALLTLNTGDYGDFPEVPLLTITQS